MLERENDDKRLVESKYRSQLKGPTHGVRERETDDKKVSTEGGGREGDE